MSDKNNDASMEAAPAGPPPLPDEWASYTADQKFEYLTSSWASTEGKPFKSDEIAEKFARRAKRYLDVLALKEPDRVPACLMVDGFLRENAGIKPAAPFYDAPKTADAVYKFHTDFECEYAAGVLPLSGSALDLVDHKLIRWPGGNLPEDMQFQYCEDEFMRADEYDELIENPDGYLLRKYFPRIMPAFKAFEMIPTPFHVVEVAGIMSFLMPFAQGSPLRKSIEDMLKTADLIASHMGPFIEVGMKVMTDFGAPATMGGITFTPFDIIGDTMRCTTAMMLDMYRRPEKVLAACKAVLPMSIKMAVETAMATRCPFVGIPLHKGADGFMSEEQFKTFYWPFFKAQMLGIIEAGLIPAPFVEGSYNQRLDIIAEDGLPAGRTMWLFDRTDMKAAKEKIGSFACIGGNIPASYFSTGTPEMIESYSKELIETAGKGGGFYLAPGAVIDQSTPENFRAFLECSKKFGVY